MKSSQIALFTLLYVGRRDDSRSGCVLLWRDVATEAIAERQAAQHLAALQRSRQVLRLAEDFAKKRLRSKAWLRLGAEKVS